MRTLLLETNRDACNSMFLSRKTMATVCCCTRSIQTRRHLTSIGKLSTSGYLQARVKHYALRSRLSDACSLFRAPMLLPKGWGKPKPDADGRVIRDSQYLRHCNRNRPE